MDERFTTQFMKIDLENLKNQFKTNINFDENLSKYNWFNTGGPAEIFFRPDNKEQIVDFFTNNNHFKNVTILGIGSNTLIRDGGIEGVTIKLSSKFSNIKLLEQNVIEVGAATLDRKIANFATENSIGGLEFLSCIPGSLGGAITMNSGCYGGVISDALVSLKTINFEGKEKEILKKDINFTYRASDISRDQVIISAKLKGFTSKKDLILLKQNQLIEQKKNSQPGKIKTCGSTFKNPKNEKAWELIKDSSCNNLSVGSAKISKKHCNFFVNEGNASSSDIEQLIDEVRAGVLKKTGICLELELKLIGKKNKNV